MKGIAKTLLLLWLVVLSVLLSSCSSGGLSSSPDQVVVKVMMDPAVLPGYGQGGTAGGASGTGTGTVSGNQIPAPTANSDSGSSSSGTENTGGTVGSVSREPAPSQPDSGASAGAAQALSTAQAVQLVNQAFADAKEQTGSRTMVIDLEKLPSGLNMLKDTIQGMLGDTGEPSEVAGVFAQNLQEGDFTSVQSEKSGENHKITMTVKTETAPDTPANGRAFSILPQDAIDEWFGKLKVTPSDGVKFIYENGTIEAVVTPEGKLVSTVNTMRISIVVDSVKVLGILPMSDAKVNLTMTDSFGV